MRHVRILFILLLLLGGGIRAVDVWRPVDGTIRESWRECDIAAVARNFYREGMNILYPRIDWRGDGPGYAEMEFPIYPWTVAVLYKTFGFHEEIGRLLSYGFSLASMVVFFKLARYLLPTAGAVGASLFFVLSPIGVRVSNALQPEGLMFLCYILAAYTFIRWTDEGKARHYWIALVSTALAILAKANAGHIGLFFAALLLKEKGFGALKGGRVWMFAVFSLLPAALWYHHAHNLWLTYGNSLGVSNEYHWIGWDFFTNPTFVLGIARLETLFVWMPAGVIIAATGGVWGWRRKEVRLSLYWFASILIYYVITSRTSSEYWAVYYHVVSIAPAALLIGTGINVLYEFGLRKGFRQISVGLGLLLSLPLALLGAWVRSKLMVATALVGFLVPLVCRIYRKRIGSLGQSVNRENRRLLDSIFMSLGMFLLCGTILGQLQVLWRDIHPSSSQSAFECSNTFRRHIADGSTILASGGASRDENGYPIAYNASYFFYWLDRKGFNISREEQSVEKVTSFSEKGARYFIGEKNEMDRMRGFEASLRENFKVLQDCGIAVLFDLSPR